MPNSILLTGAAGFVGMHLAAALAGRYPSSRRSALLRDPVEPPAGWEGIIANLLDASAIEALVEKCQPDLIIHLAAQASVGQSAQQVLETWQVNLMGTLALAAAAARLAPHATFLFASSAEVYGASFKTGLVDEATHVLPLSAYAKSKIAAEYLLQDVLPPHVRLIIARPFNHSGPGQDERFVLPSFAAQIARIEAGLCLPVLHVGNLDARRDFLHVDDVVQAYLALAGLTDMPSRVTVNIGSGQAVRIGDLLARLQAMSTRQFEVVLDLSRLRPSEIPSAVGSSAHLHKLTGWQPSRSQDQLLNDLLIEWRQRVGTQRGPTAG